MRERAKASSPGHSSQLARHLVIGLPLLAIVGCATDEEPVDPDSCDPAEVFRIDRVDLPLTSRDARAIAFDLDRSGVVDNQIGQVMGTLEGYFDEPFDLGGAATAHATTDVVWTVAIRRCPAQHVLVSIGREGQAVELVGTTIGGTINARGEGGELPLSALFDPLQTFTDAGWLGSELSEIQFADPGGGARLDARVGLAPRTDLAITAIARPMLGFLQQRAPGNASLRESFDRDQDGVITLREVETNRLTQSLLVADLDDGAISLAITISASRVP